MEKFLKAFLLSKGWQLRRIHDLDAILDDAVTLDESLETFRSVCQKITAFYLMQRYPYLIESGIEVEDVRSSLDQVKGLISRVRENFE